VRDPCVELLSIPSQLLVVKVLRRPLEFTLRAVVRVCDHGLIFVFLPPSERHLERVADQGLPHVTRQLPADDPPCVNVKNDGEVAPPFPGVDVREVGQPQLVGPIRAEVALHQILGRNRRETRDRRAARRPFAHAFDAIPPHQAFHRAAGNADLLALELLPCLQLPVDLERLGMNTMDLAEDKLIMSRA
jgi:hypothetical protein